VRRRYLSPYHEMPTVVQMPTTPDGFCELTVEVRGKIIATEIVRPSYLAVSEREGHDANWSALKRLTEAVRAKC
jgi:hypothetical protein